MPAKKKAETKTVTSSASQNIWMILGSDDAVVKDRARELVKKYTPAGGDDFSVDIIEGSADNADHAGRILRNTTGALQEYGMFGSGKVVWLKDTNVFADTVTGRANDTVAGLEQLIKALDAGLPPDVTLVISARDVDKRRSAFLSFKKLGQVEVFDTADISKSGWEELVMPGVKRQAEDYGLEMAEDALRLFVMLAGEKTRQVTNELEKLDLYLGEHRRKVTLDDVRSIVSETHAGVIWDLGNAIAARDLPRALRVTDQLLYHGEKAIGILLSTVIPKVRGMWQTSEIFASQGYDFSQDVNFGSLTRFVGGMPPEIQASLPQKKDGGVNVGSLMYNLRDLNNYTPQELRAALEHCLNANKTLVTARLEPKIVLSMLLLRILGKSRQKKLPRAA